MSIPPPHVYEEGVKHHREDLSAAERALSVNHTIDPGFVNRRLTETVLGQPGADLISQQIKALPDMPDWQKETRIGHVYKDVTLAFCRVNKIKTLGEIIHNEKGRMFCSTEPFAPTPAVFDASDRIVTKWSPYGAAGYDVELHYSRSHITSDTLRSELHSGGELSVVAIYKGRHDRTLIFHPLVIGSPWLHIEDERWAAQVPWWNLNFFEHFVEDFDEFAKVRDVSAPADVAAMQAVSETAFKRALAAILGGQAPTDWGGETSDFVTTHIHLQGRRVSAAFLLKGPARFAPMTLNHLGKNNDQIFRLAQEPVDVLFVQHSHEVTSPVRATLRAFAVQPSNARRYCVLDGRDSLRLLQAYGLYDQAVAWSQKK